MRTKPSKTGRATRCAVVAMAALGVAALGGCGGGAQTAAVVHLALTAPTEGATVSVNEVRVFGTVDPAGASVIVAGRHAHVSHGVFARWMVLRRGLSHIRVTATAAGYAPAKLDVAVRSSPQRSAKPPSAAPREEVAASPSPTASPAGKRYASQVQTMFLRACKLAGDTPTVTAGCECALSYLEAHVSQRELQATELAVLRGEAKLPQWLRAAATACRRT